jgi:NAD-dependent SIR2 family protein deacetylase
MYKKLNAKVLKENIKNNITSFNKKELEKELIFGNLLEDLFSVDIENALNEDDQLAIAGNSIQVDPVKKAQTDANLARLEAKKAKKVEDLDKIEKEITKVGQQE